MTPKHLDLSRLNPPKPKFQVRYCLGLIFDPEFTRVLLIVKNRPCWQLNKLNGIGGKIETGESDLEAMNREFQEETGLDLPGRFGADSVCHFEWQKVGSRYRPALHDNQPQSFEMIIYAGTLCLEAMKKAKTTSDEVVVALPLNLEIIKKLGVPGLAWTVDLAMQSLREGFVFRVIDPINLDHLGRG